MTARSPLSMLYARLQLVLPEARSILIAPATSSLDAFPTGRRLAELAAATGCRVRLVQIARASAADSAGHLAEQPLSDARSDFGAGKVEQVQLPETELGNMERLRCALESSHDLTIIAGRGLLDSPATLLAAAVADGVVVLARRGTTARTELERVRMEVERAGGRIAGAVVIG